MSVQIMRTFFEAQKLKTKVEDKPKAQIVEPETPTEVKVTEVKSEVTEVKTEVTAAEVVSEEVKVTRAAETNEIVEVEKNIEASAEEVEDQSEDQTEEKTEAEEKLEVAEELPEDELITATSSDDDTANESIMSVNKGQGTTVESCE